MKRFFTTFILSVLLIGTLPSVAHAQQVLVPGGNVIGLHLEDDTVTVAAFDQDLGGAAREAGLEIGDRVLEIQGQAVDSAEDIRDALQKNPDQVSLTVARGSKVKTLNIKPQMAKTGPKLGIFLRQGVSGIGTVTWYDPDSHRFGTLGHGVSSRQGMLIRMTEGTVYNAEVSSVVPGKKGKPGLLKGSANADSPSGSLYRNTPQGVFGKTKQDLLGQPLPTAVFSQLHTGDATIRSTVSGKVPQEYSVEILKIYPENREDCRNFLLQVTDPRLLSATGGIVQGMSGSPVIQDGRIVGAVTHVSAHP